MKLNATHDPRLKLELGFLIGPGNPLGKPVQIAKALDHVFGVTLFND